uniref:Uncharacterized protein n=1 Tax=Plectus sambesii TaxID=2011161 RepID=A0A914UPJ2_9BILA
MVATKNGPKKVYKIYTSSIRLLVHLPPTYDKTFDLVAALGSVRFPLLASVCLLSNCKERALDICRIEPEEEDGDEVSPDSDRHASPPSASSTARHTGPTKSTAARHAPPTSPTARPTRRASAAASGARRLLSTLAATSSSRRPPAPTVHYSTSTEAVHLASSSSSPVEDEGEMWE